MDEDGMDIEMEEIIDSDVVKKEAEQRQKMKQAALESGIEPEQVSRYPCAVCTRPYKCPLTL